MSSVPPPLPVGFRLQPDARTRWSEGGRVLDGGAPWRLLRLSARGATVARDLLAGRPVGGDGDGALARRLVEAGLAHALPPVLATPMSVTVVVPVRDRAGELDDCLKGLEGLDVVVVDDGSADGAAVAAAATRHGARMVRREIPGGPAAARNAGLRAVGADVVTFVDSDCRVATSTIRALMRHLGDPAVAAVAPRVRPAGDDVDGRRSPLDMGDQAATVAPGARVSYVPTTAVVIRRAALLAVGGFDESLRYGEDVDLCWRLGMAGWSVRYDPRVVVRHVEPASLTRSLARRFHYGTSAGPLARRHPGALRGPSLQGLVAPLTLARMRRGEGVALPADVQRRVARTAPVSTATGLVRWATPLWCPPAAALWEGPRRALVSVADEAAYGVGVWWGCLRARTLEPLLPAVSARRRTSSP
jgi:mycofactocin system glycosyltransferase